MKVVCRIRLKAERSVRCAIVPPEDDDSDSGGSITSQLMSLQLNKVSAKKERIFTKVELNGKMVDTQLDSGANVTVISEDLARKIPRLKRTPCREIVHALASGV